MGMLPRIAGMVGSSSPVVGFGVHLLISAMIGAGFGVALGSVASTAARSLGAGAAYGMVWWVLGPLTIMPLMMGMGFGTQWTGSAMSSALPSLMGHVLYGLITGFVYYRLRARGALSASVHSAWPARSSNTSASPSAIQ